MTDIVSNLGKALFAIIIIFILVITFNLMFPDLQQKTISIVDDTLKIGQETAGTSIKEEALLSTKETLKTDIQACFTKGTKDYICDLERGTIYSGYEITILNQNGIMGIMTNQDNGNIFDTDEINYAQLGILAINEVNGVRTLGCIFPERFEIKAKSFTDNQSWYVTYDGEDYDLYEYFDYEISGAEISEKIPELYSLSESQFCLITELIEKDSQFTNLNPVSTTDFSTGNKLDKDYLFRYLSELSAGIKFEINHGIEFPLNYWCCQDTDPQIEERNAYMAEENNCPFKTGISFCQHNPEQISSLCARESGIIEDYLAVELLNPDFDEIFYYQCSIG